jgi:hypothetical protein
MTVLRSTPHAGVQENIPSALSAGMWNLVVLCRVCMAAELYAPGAALPPVMSGQN